MCLKPRLRAKPLGRTSSSSGGRAPLPPPQRGIDVTAALGGFSPLDFYFLNLTMVLGPYDFLACSPATVWQLAVLGGHCRVSCTASSFRASRSTAAAGRGCHALKAIAMKVQCAGRWALSRRQRNKLLHMLHGNGPRGRDAWQPVAAGGRRHVGGSSGGGAAEAKLLQEPQEVRKLRALGWEVLDSIPDETVVQVYDTRLRPDWIRGVLVEAGLAGDSLVVGGDFMTKPHLEDVPALNPARLERWGTPGTGDYHIFVPPRPHQALWLQRAQRQLAMEVPTSTITVGCVVPRDALDVSLCKSSLLRALPGLRPMLEDVAVAVRVHAIGERPPLRRVPATEEKKQLPPAKWEHAYLAADRVLLLVTLQHAMPGEQRFHSRWMRGEPPQPRPADYELLRFEAVLPPATKQQAAERLVRGKLTKLAVEMGLQAPPPSQVRQVQVMHGMAVGILLVPRSQALQWLRGSGCGSTFLRPFWTGNTGKELERGNFALLWARGRFDRAADIWAAVREQPGVVGLYADPNGKDVAVRVTVDADVSQVQAQLRHGLRDDTVSFRRAVAGLRWWKLGPLHASEEWHVKELIAKLGLVPLDNTLSTASAGPFRCWVHFASTGDPVEAMTLDDGSWGASSARLLPSRPPPRRTLPGTVVWAGPRTSASVLPSPGQPAQTRGPKVAEGYPERPPPSTNFADRGKAFPALPQPAGSSGGIRPRSSQRKAARSPSPPSGDLRTTALEARLDRVLVQLEMLQQQNTAMLQEMSQLRRENDLLRRKLRAAGPGNDDPSAAEDLQDLQAGRRAAVRPRAELDDDEEALPRTPPGGHGGAGSRPAAMVTDSPAKIAEPGSKRVHVPQQPSHVDAE